MTTIDERFMRVALGHAKTALTQGWIPVGAVFVRRGTIVAHGIKTGTIHPLFDHAEHNGCYQALWSTAGPKNLAGCTVYSTLEPCLTCMSMLMTSRVDRIVYGCEDPYGGGRCMLEHPEILPERFDIERPVLVGGVLRKPSMLLLREFFMKPRKKGSPWSKKENALRRLVCIP